jgi:hypothetical protein
MRCVLEPPRAATPSEPIARASASEGSGAGRSQIGLLVARSWMTSGTDPSQQASKPVGGGVLQSTPCARHSRADQRQVGLSSSRA